MICAASSGKNTYQGDSGGPLIIWGVDYTEDVVVGVVSYGVDCANLPFPGVYARVSKGYDWISQNVGPIGQCECKCLDSPYKSRVTDKNDIETKKYCVDVTSEDCKVLEITNHCKASCDNPNCCEDSGAEFKVGKKGWKGCKYVFKKKEEWYEDENLALTCGETCDCNNNGSYVSGTLILFVIILR